MSKECLARVLSVFCRSFYLIVFLSQVSEGEASAPYQSVVEELQTLAHFGSPLEKLECIGQLWFEIVTLCNIMN